MTTVPIHVYKCWDCGSVAAVSPPNITSTDIECFGTNEKPHEQTFMECVLESSIVVEAMDGAA